MNMLRKLFSIWMFGVLGIIAAMVIVSSGLEVDAFGFWILVGVTTACLYFLARFVLWFFRLLCWRPFLLVYIAASLWLVCMVFFPDFGLRLVLIFLGWGMAWLILLGIANEVSR